MDKVFQDKNALSPEELSALNKLSQSPEWIVLCRLMDNRVFRDKNAIISYPEQEPIKLATMKAFYRGRISAIYLIKREVIDAGKKLEVVETKVEKKEIKKK